MKNNIDKLIDKNDILSILELGNLDPNVFTSSTTYDALILGKLYPPKDVLRQAAIKKGLNFDKLDLKEGRSTNELFMGMGFPIFNKKGNYIGGGDDLKVWNLSTRWNTTYPDSYSFFKNNNIVISYDNFHFQIGDLVAISDGLIVNAIAKVSTEMIPIVDYGKFKQDLKNIGIPWVKQVLITDVLWLELSDENKVKLISEEIVNAVNNKGDIDSITKLWYEAEYRMANTGYSSTSSKQNEKSLKFGANDFITSDSNVDPRLDVAILSKNFAKLILSLKDNTGQMLGVFGQWGRGKTFFVNQVHKALGINHSKGPDINGYSNQFYFLKFHAWKYQDTEAVWAYLYQQIAEVYFSHKNKEEWNVSSNNWLKRRFYSLRRTINEKVLLIRLNLTRNGYFDFWMFGLTLVFLIIITIFFPNYITKIIWLESFVLVQVFSFFVKSWKLGDNGKRIMKKYTHKPSFSELLGVQAETQEELKYLLKAWIKTDVEISNGEIVEKIKNNEKRLLLFVDDIDRCDEDRLIQVIDALRVMLEDKDISLRVIVITAIDEKILKRSIAWKYKEVFSSADNNEMIKEYIDKLFIAGIKLPSLYSYEREAILNNYAKKLNVLFNETKKTKNKANKTIGKPADNRAPATPTLIKVFEIPDGELEFVLTSEELKILNNKSSLLTRNSTPRQLRIFMYRYLLAKAIATSMNRGEHLDDKWCSFIINEIVARTNNPETNKKISIEEELNLMNASQELKKFTPKLLDIIVPY